VGQVIRLKDDEKSASRISSLDSIRMNLVIEYLSDQINAICNTIYFEIDPKFHTKDKCPKKLLTDETLTGKFHSHKLPENSKSSNITTSIGRDSQFDAAQCQPWNH
jgi:hypothetical protein